MCAVGKKATQLIQVNTLYTVNNASVITSSMQRHTC